MLTGTGNLNTLHVSVQLSFNCSVSSFFTYLNTLHVSVQLSVANMICNNRTNLNTLHVSVQLLLVLVIVIQKWNLNTLHVSVQPQENQQIKFTKIFVSPVIQQFQNFFPIANNLLTIFASTSPLSLFYNTFTRLSLKNGWEKCFNAIPVSLSLHILNACITRILHLNFCLTPENLPLLSRKPSTVHCNGISIHIIGCIRS